MRQSGATLQQTGNYFGISREWVRKLLDRHYGSTRIGELLTAAELAAEAGCSPAYLRKLKRRGVIQPARVVGQSTLWKPETVATIITYVDQCQVCHRPLPSDRWAYCSTACSIEHHREDQRKKAAERYGSTDYVICKRCLIPLGTVVRVASGIPARGRVKVDWDGRILELPFGFVKRVRLKCN